MSQFSRIRFFEGKRKMNIEQAKDVNLEDIEFQEDEIVDIK
jgi:hypothetical protein